MVPKLILQADLQADSQADPQVDPQFGPQAETPICSFTNEEFPVNVG